MRVSCQTIALKTGMPVFLSQTRAVSRWLVMPTAARSLPVIPALSRAPLMTSRQRVQISIASCSTQPGFG